MALPWTTSWHRQVVVHSFLFLMGSRGRPHGVYGTVMGLHGLSWQCHGKQHGTAMGTRNIYCAFDEILQVFMKICHVSAVVPPWHRNVFFLAVHGSPLAVL